jgi:adenylosuccinate lyase
VSDDVLYRFSVICDRENLPNPAITATSQWFERTLDDSANKRLSIPEGFLAVDAILTLYINVVRGLVVYPKVIEQHFMKEIPFMATENILMRCVKKGGDRQALHEKLRKLSIDAGRRVKEEGLDNKMCELIAADPDFGVTIDELNHDILKPANFVGRAAEQVDEFVQGAILPIIDSNQELLGLQAEVKV